MVVARPSYLGQDLHTVNLPDAVMLVGTHNASRAPPISRDIVAVDGRHAAAAAEKRSQHNVSPVSQHRSKIWASELLIKGRGNEGQRDTLQREA